jgi:hypothetical protein
MVVFLHDCWFGGVRTRGEGERRHCLNLTWRFPIPHHQKDILSPLARLLDPSLQRPR